VPYARAPGFCLARATSSLTEFTGRLVSRASP
jgi:hypothetical protein